MSIELLYDALVKEWEDTGRLMHDISLKKEYDYQRFDLLTQYQRGIRFSLDFIDDFNKTIKKVKESD